MSSSVKAIGDLFKNKREEMHLSLKEVENATSIRMIYLEAIEEGQVDKYLSSVYAIGFIKQYANFLGLDVKELTKSFPNSFRSQSVAQEFTYGIGTLDVRGNHSNSAKWLPNIIWMGISLLVLVAAWYLARFLGIF
ncbi:MAG: helix-turn-helix domain-containing protein [Parachlamydiales bacterium]|nr:helix-turn-helix domain-containing protein [Parachlamydiales bacterium]